MTEATGRSSTPQEQGERLAREEFLQDETFTEVELASADLQNKELQRCVFRRCKLVESLWAGSKLEDCIFEACDLSRMKPEKLALRGVTFKGSRVMGVDWTDLSPFPVMSFEECDLRYASFVKLRLRSTKWWRCIARDANFLELDLGDADFADSDLTGSTIRGCSLLNTDFSRATGVIFDPARNKTKGARISVESAVLIAQSFGLVVSGFTPP